jgi:hypothetical protein
MMEKQLMVDRPEIAQAVAGSFNSHFDVIEKMLRGQVSNWSPEALRLRVWPGSREGRGCAGAAARTGTGKPSSPISSW